MSHIPTLSLSALLLLPATNSYANNLKSVNIDQKLQLCASTALQHRGQIASVISINNGDLTSSELDHNLLPSSAEYRMNLVNKESGQDLGIVRCTVSRSGKLLAAAFEQ